MAELTHYETWGSGGPEPGCGAVVRASTRMTRELYNVSCEECVEWHRQYYGAKLTESRMKEWQP